MNLWAGVDLDSSDLKKPGISGRKENIKENGLEFKREEKWNANQAFKVNSDIIMYLKYNSLTKKN